MTCTLSLKCNQTQRPTFYHRHKPIFQRRLRSYAAKELDAETGLYYYGARYLDPKTSRWMSTDPAMYQGDYIPGAPINDEAKKRNGNLPGQGGIFNYVNMHVYHYAGNNPVKYTDPDGEKIKFAKGTDLGFRIDVWKMTNYLNKHGNGDLIKELKNRPEVVYLKRGAKLNDFWFSSSKKEIVMHPKSGLKIDEGKIQSPALGYLHEVGHAMQSILNPEQFKNDTNTSDTQYNTAEEKRVIETIETPAAIKMGEPTRNSHGGSEVEVKKSTYSENKLLEKN